MRFFKFDLMFILSVCVIVGVLLTIKLEIGHSDSVDKSVPYSQKSGQR